MEYGLESGFYYERGLQKADGSTNKGRFGRSARLLKDSENSLILAGGFGAGTDERERLDIREGVLPGAPMDLRSSTVIGMAWNLRSACRNRWSASPECAAGAVGEEGRVEVRSRLPGPGAR